MAHALMNEYQKLIAMCDVNYKKLDHIRNKNVAMNTLEDSLYEKIEIKCHDLELLKHEYNNIIETYGHIVRCSVNPS
jgi:hypothetical protein